MKKTLRAMTALLTIGLPVCAQARLARTGAAAGPISIPRAIVPPLTRTALPATRALTGALGNLPVPRKALGADPVLAVSPLPTPRVMALPATLAGEDPLAPTGAVVEPAPARESLTAAVSAVEGAVGPAGAESRHAALEALFEGAQGRGVAGPEAFRPAVEDSELRQHLDEAGRMSAAWAVNEMIESYYERKKFRLSPRQVGMLLSGLISNDSHAHSRLATHYRIADSYFQQAATRLTPYEVLSLTSGLGDAWQTNYLIERYFLLTKGNLRWDDVKLLLWGLTRSYDSYVYRWAATQDRILREWEKLAHRG